MKITDYLTEEIDCIEVDSLGITIDGFGIWHDCTSEQRPYLVQMIHSDTMICEECYKDFSGYETFLINAILMEPRNVQDVS